MRQNIFEYDEKSNAYVIKVAMPLIKKDQVVIDEDCDGRLVIKVNGDNPFHIQPVHLTVDKRIDEKKAEATLDGGVFVLRMPLEKRRTIAIK